MKSNNVGLHQISTPNGKHVFSRDEVINDYRIAFQSRCASLIGRKEVLTGKAKFGIFGDGKELAQIAMAKAFRAGDFRSGYYRDQTFMFATGMCSVSEFFAQLYANVDLQFEPASGGRMMNAHFGSRLLDEDGNWKNVLKAKNTSSDISPTAGQMARLLGLAYASKLYRNDKALKNFDQQFSHQGNEVAFGTIGNASTSEGVFFETVNAAGVLQVPMAISVWDDGYGISVPNEFQTTKCSISEVLKGLQRDEKSKGYDIHVVKGWDYLALCQTYLGGIEKTRTEHVPSLFHIVEVTQPQGHSTSGSHERYKTKERLAWEEEYCCLKKMRQWMLDSGIATEKELDSWEAEDRKLIEKIKKEAWDAYLNPLKIERNSVAELLKQFADEGNNQKSAEILALLNELQSAVTLNRKLIQSIAFRALATTAGQVSKGRSALEAFFTDYRKKYDRVFNSHLYSESKQSPLCIPELKPQYSDASESGDGRMILVKFFDQLFGKDPRTFVIGEDCGKLGDVNLVFEGLQDKHGDLKVTDTGIREATILGQGIGSALRGLRPLVDIQYLDYLLYALQTLSDDLATLHYRSAGGQKAPVIIRTKGHRLEGIWHTGSPIGMILHAIRGLYVCVPRNMTQAAGMYGTLFQGDNPALVIEVLNGYRLKERFPDNIGEYTVPLGVPEVIRAGSDLTIVTYGACCRLAQDACQELSKVGIDVEVIDVQTLIPFDTGHLILESLKKTNAVLFLDEDVPGGASAYMMQEVLEVQGGYDWLDAAPRTLAAKSNRAAYATDGDYYCKPSVEDIYELIYSMMQQRFPKKYPKILS
jgi:2-oxoisovalerate dehydrogenase E1 component